MKVVFTYYPAFVKYNHGISVLSRICKNRGITTRIIPMCRSWEDEINKFSPDYVCFSFVTKHDYQLSRPYISACRFPKLAGGVYARKGGSIQEDFLHICRGEGEDIADFFLSGETTIFDSPQLTENIDLLPDYDHVIGYEFDRGYPFLKGKKIIPYSHSRGCPYSCGFCEAQNLPKKIRIKKDVANDLEKLRKRFSPDMFYFLDELLPYYSKEWRDQFDGNITPFMAYIRADIQTEDLLFLIRNKMTCCAIGIESGDEEYRNSVLKKGLSDSDIYRTIAMLKVHGVEYIVFYMVFTPGETEEMRAKTMGMKRAIGGHSTVWQYENLRA